MVLNDISEHHKSEAESQKKSLKLEMAYENLRYFDLSHSQNLKTLLNKVESNAFSLLDESLRDLGDTGRSQLLALIKALTKVRNLINEQIIFSGTLRGAGAFKSIDLTEVMSEVLYDLEMRIKQTQGHVIVVKLPRIEASVFMMRVMFHNLISNSLRFRKEGLPPVVTIDSQPVDNGFWEIAVEDNGTGLDGESMERIQNLFANPKPVKIDDNFEGLSICHRIVTLHKGTITVTNQLETGVKFIIKLPEKQATV